MSLNKAELLKYQGQTDAMPLDDILGAVIDEINNKKVAAGLNGLSYDITGKDLNDIKDTGFYYGNNVKNNPENFTSVFLIVLSHSESKSYSSQIVYSLHSGQPMESYIRKQYNSEWSEWRKINMSPISYNRNTDADFDAIYNSNINNGMTLHKISGGQPVGCPQGCYYYGLLINFGLNESYANTQIYIEDNIGSRNDRYIYIRIRNGSWLKLSGTVVAKITT